MRCKNCDYPLWNLTAHKCPECGLDFKPSDFHFVPNSVRYCCPHCEQQYYGTTEHGHLIPRTFTCVQCGQRIDMDKMVLRPADGVEESRTAADVMPWLQRKHFGWFKGWARTVGMAMIAPNRLMRAVPLEGGLGDACLFAIITHLAILACGLALPFLVIGLLMSSSSAGRGGQGMFGAAAGSLLGGTAGVLITATLWALLTHGLLKISGGTQRRLGRTMQAMYYSSAANALCAIPCVGVYPGALVLWIWWMVSAIFMVMEGQKVSGVRATLCVGAGPVLGIGGFIAYVVLMVFLVRNSFSAIATGSMGGYVPVAEVRAMSAGIISYASAHNGAGPTHAIAMVADGNATAADFVVFQIGHDEKLVPLPGAGISLDAFQYLPTNRMQIAAQAVIATQPANVIAHRLGDVVFTYHGIDLRNADPQLWIAIISPDPGQANAGGPQTLAPTAVLTGGGFIPIAPSMPIALQTQNVLRAKYNLPPLPDPATVLDGQPATSTTLAPAPLTQPSP